MTFRAHIITPDNPNKVTFTGSRAYDLVGPIFGGLLAYYTSNSNNPEKEGW